MKDTINTLINSDISAYQISKGTGVAASGIQRIRSGERKIENLTLENAEKLYQYQQQLETTSGAILTDDQLQSIELKVKDMKNVRFNNKHDDSIELIFNSDIFIVTILFSKSSTQVKAYALIHNKKFGEEITSINSIKKLYDTLHQYLAYFNSDKNICDTVSFINSLSKTTV
ncbi:hypothetical protein KYI07_12730 (plasmid) [Macrococcus psychrotolerans]|uniref:XRE family transcriptional regulator n=2 Tax=Staphylococcaceae TaxID=90964 RepID=A0A8F8LR44_9STAP|nr:MULTISPECIES: hypothetical protein [Macrococcus]QYA34119.1 hypothetical protein KYI10_11315 [Macrococcus sp. 19Msa1099]QYA38921.1 hypothetical protein KYI07_11935 [Macrococcus caseolyticus]QYA77626.1 hypothetical protein KYI12_11300 [Macrococcus caseolyticus]